MWYMHGAAAQLRASVSFLMRGRVRVVGADDALLSPPMTLLFGMDAVAKLRASVVFLMRGRRGVDAPHSIIQPRFRGGAPCLVARAPAELLYLSRVSVGTVLPELRVFWRAPE